MRPPTVTRVLLSNDILNANTEILPLQSHLQSNYDWLRQIKDKLDPDSVFFAHTAVGSEDWVIDIIAVEGFPKLIKEQVAR